jgi:uncharacterized protein (TIGR03435 family)
MKESAPDAKPSSEDPWAFPQYKKGKDNCPVFPPGRGGRTQGLVCNRWTGFNLSMQEIVQTLSSELRRTVVDATGLKGKYDIDITWYREWDGPKEVVGEEPADFPHGPNLIHAVRDQLGLELISKRGPGDIVVVDHVEKVPTEN